MGLQHINLGNTIQLIIKVFADNAYPRSDPHKTKCSNYVIIIQLFKNINSLKRKIT